ncbi:unnamed protein product [Zymoseptoria tritici ST99CH_3D7]|uniref:DNA repair protein REV1 n=1 Tax=Zymoseptoria tritici (strain ST99CH_3D7) TaxID=1276538 RepID=A0A1X7RW30_ZYMT9|nr:unnamed protein product [Zymoseptoria tritici ST99CH_3D7]
MGSRLEEKSKLVRKRIEGHTFQDEGGEEYEGSKFGGFSDYFRRKKIKLQNLDAEVRAQTSDKPQIFKGVTCHVNGYTQPSLNDLHTMIVQHGGGFLQYLDGKTMVTHIIASNLTPKKKEEFRRYRIVKPAWVVDSVKAGKLLPWNEYRMLDEGVAQKVLGFENGQVVTQANRRTQGYREQTDASWYTSQFNAASSTAGPSKPAFATQTVTPSEEIEDDDDFPLPEVTSSIEEALDEASRLHSKQQAEPLPAEPSTDLQTPPPTSPPPHHSPATRDEPAQTVEAATATPEKPKDAALGLLSNGKRKREWEGLEPDYSMAVVKNSNVWDSVSPSKLAAMTAEQHNSLILSDPNIRKSTVVNPGFLQQYYDQSRLHHLSTWKADLKSQLQAIAAETSASQKSRQKRLPGQRRYVMHVDFDSFFAAVSLKKHPEYNDKPTVVAHGNGSGSEIASCNYPARKFGISNGMWMKRALELCPELKILPYDFPAYEDASRKFYDAIMATGGLVQSVSIDEALIDISTICIAESGQDGVKRSEGAVHREQSKADELGQRLRDEVLEKTGCAVSVGIGANILQAKVALRKAKPAGQYQLKPEDVLDFIGQLEVQKLPGVAWSIGGKLEEIGIKLVKDIRDVSRERLINTLGPKTGEKIWEYARGIDKTEVGDQVVRKSVSAEVNWGVRFENNDQVDEFMQGLCGELNKRLVKERVKGKQLTMKVMRRAANAPLDPPKHLGHGKCDVYNKSSQLGVATNDPSVITKEAIAMLRSFKISPGELRGIGVQMQKLEPIKSGVDGVDQGSQRRLQFKAGPVAKPVVEDEPSKAVEDAIVDDIKTPQKARIPAANRPSAAFTPIEPGTPSRKPLNTLGTQFILPTQVDPAVLAELPEDIRAKLAKHVPKPEAKKLDLLPTANVPSRAQSPAVGLPTLTQIDPDILSALPDDVRDEILGFYNQPAPAKRPEQAVLPQSPRKTRTLPAPRQPVKRGRGRPRGGSLLSNRLRSAAGESSTLTQSNFVSRPSVPTTTSATTTDNELEDIDPEVLAALPEDLRLEVLAQQRSAKLQRTGGIDLSLHARPKTGKTKKLTSHIPGEVLATGDRHFLLPPHAPKPSFTSRKLTEVEELRTAIKAWFEEFRDEGPYGEDVEALGKYLGEVVGSEGDLEKAVKVAKWVGFVVEEGVEEWDEEDVIGRWRDAVARVEECVRLKARERGIEGVVF